LGLARLTLLWLWDLARGGKQLLRGEFLAQFIEFLAAYGFLFFSLTFRRLEGLLCFQCSIGQIEWVVRIQTLCGSRVEGIAPGYARVAGVRVDATSAEAADALAR
jgi:hypothetical protein